MGRATVTRGKRHRAPLTLQQRRQAVRDSLVASSVLPTYDLLYGSQMGLLFEQACSDAGYREIDSAWWPTEAAALSGERAVYRDGQHGAVYQLEDGTLVLATLHGDSISVKAAGPTRASVGGALAAFQGLYPASFVTTEGDSRVPITFWSNSQFGPQPRLRRIEAAAWEPIKGNYGAEVRDELDAIMAWDEPPDGEGQMLLWQGPPGTGKTWALRALACEWARWAEFNYITDPDSFFVDDPSYMVNVLLSDSYAVMDPADGSVFEEQAEGKWRVLILEDTGELLSAKAKERYGQGLSRLLNVVDGMIGQGLRVLCLVTTNDELGELNEAALRPGRMASQIVFGSLTDEEAQAWTGDAEATAGTIAELYSRYGKAERPAEFTDEPEDARDLMASAVSDETRVRAEIAAVAAEHEPDGGYGETYWNEADRIVFWVSADWTSNDEVDAAEQAFLAIDGVDGLEHEAEGYPPDDSGWEQVWPERGGDAALDALLTLASEPLTLEEPAAVVAAVRARTADGGSVEQALAAVAEAHRQTVESIGAIVASAAVQEGTTRGDELALRTLDVLERFATRPAEPAPQVTVNVPERETHLHVPAAERLPAPVVHIDMPDQPAPHFQVVLPEQAPPVVNVAPAAAPDVHVHVPEQAPASVEVITAAAHPVRERPVEIRVEFDEHGNKLYVPVYDEPEA